VAHRRKLKLDKIGYWSKIKLDIIRDYAKAYSTILAGQKNPRFHHVYVDAFAGAGVHLSKTTGAKLEGSPLIAVNTQPPFKEYHFIDLDGLKVNKLLSTFGMRPDVHIHEGDCNEILLKEVLPKIRWERYQRGLCLLDPYGLHLDWGVIRKIGQMKSIDMFLNFPIADMNRNVFWRNPEGVAEDDIARMNAFWGDESWREIVYEPVQTLFGPEAEKTDNETIASAFRVRLKKWLDSVTFLSRSRCAIARGLWFTIYSSPRPSPWPKRSSLISSTNTEIKEKSDGAELRD
jgi:three-Cys-motif partner protein